MAIEEMTLYYTALASIIGLVVNLMVSFMLKGKWNAKVKNTLKGICAFFFVALVATLFMHTKFFIEGTFSYQNFENEVSYYIKGSEYTNVAKKFKEENPYIESDEDLIREGFGSPEEKGKVWTQESINNNWMKMLTTYCLIVIFFVGLISILIEVLMGKYGKSTGKMIESF
ncbi:hypothetical protein [Algoriphagus jejuensis]|uniref:hypothetical protein n=1 Tax=Algoriphagus jejuensis TaxID=419934 RepID=UPI0031D7E8F1